MFDATSSISVLAQLLVFVEVFQDFYAVIEPLKSYSHRLNSDDMVCPVSCQAPSLATDQPVPDLIPTLGYAYWIF
jgi:hypothetical protein